MNCLTWVEAYAFCIWDGGFLPTEAEWNYAAAGGDEAREYPWGNAEPAPEFAVYYCRSGGTPGCFWPVGSKPLGDGRFGQADMAGSSWEWALDSFIEYQMDWLDCLTAADACTDYPIQDCQDCAYLQTTFEKVIRGGSMTDATWNLRSAKRADAGFLDVRNDIGMRCARAP
jgi:formylglycine-generating enzyme required for sulfatase activity